MRVLLVANLVKARNFQPLGLEYLSACLKRAGHDVRLADAGFPSRTERLAREFAPGLIGYYATTGLHVSLLELNGRLKARLTFVSLFGGPHPTYFPEMIATDGVDVVCRGEAEEAVVDLARALADQTDPRAIPNFWFKADGRVIENPVRPLVQDLDALPLPDWGLSDAFPYCRAFPVKIFLASRGCPFTCSFCYNPNFRDLYRGEKVYRVRRPENVVEEIARCRAERRFSFAYLFDDTFGVDRAWLATFCRLYRERVGLPFYANLRADVVTGEAVRELAAAGLAYAGVGLESGSETTRAELLNKRVRDEDLVRAARLLTEHRVPFTTFNILGLPASSLEDDLGTLRTNRLLRPAFAEALMFQPYPKTVLGDEAVARGLFSGDPDRIAPTFKRRGPLALDDAEPRVRLLYLFALLAAFPLGESALRRLLRLPLDPLYRLVARVHEGLVKIFRIYRVSIPLPVLARMFWHYLRY
jgi:radical SAM superfamily enzyme YgiQ (UPF0313 family)